jgi:cell division septation protein DedD
VGPGVTETAGDALPFSVAIASYQALELAEARVAQLREEEPQLSFFVGPFVVQGALSYRVMAGPVGDSVSATALVDSLVKKRIKTVTSGWDVLTTPYAFFLGEYASLEDAKAQQRTAALKAIPSYIVEVASPDGSTHHKVYAGAYAGHGDAEFMRSILKRAGLPENLVERTGSIRT